MVQMIHAVHCKRWFDPVFFYVFTGSLPFLTISST